MFLIKCIICILTFILFAIASYDYGYHYNRHPIQNKIIWATAIILGIVFCVLLVATNWNLFVIPKIILFIMICLGIICHFTDELIVTFCIAIIITIISYIIAGIMYFSNIDKNVPPEVTTINCEIICAKDNSSLAGSISGGVFYVQGSISEKSVYKYYYELEDGGIKLGTIPADSTTIYFVEEGENAYLETIVTTTYWANNNKKPATRWFESTKTYYKLYIPQGSITNVYEFDAQ